MLFKFEEYGKYAELPVSGVSFAVQSSFEET
jgi:hypothetical protein